MFFWSNLELSECMSSSVLDLTALTEKMLVIDICSPRFSLPSDLKAKWSSERSSNSPTTGPTVGVGRPPAGTAITTQLLERSAPRQQI